MPASWAQTREAHRLAVREQVLASAVALLRERGAAALTMSALATHAGVSRATLYNHFPDLEHVLLAWVSDELAAFRADLDERLRGVDDPLDALGVYLLAQAEYFTSAEQRFSMSGLASGPLGPHFGAALGELFGWLHGRIRQMLADAADAGRLHADLDLDLHTELVLGLVDGTRRALIAGSLTSEQAADVVLRLLRDGIVRDPAPPAG